MTPRFNRLLIVAGLLIGLPWYWLLLDNRPGDVPAKPVAIADLRKAAAAIPGQAPVAIETELVGWRKLPGTLFVAGAGIKRKLVAIMAFRLPVPGGSEIVIDSGMTRPAAEAMGLEAFLPERQAKVDAALQRASLVLITHEHPDHIGGLLNAGIAVIAQRARLNPGQTPPGASPGIAATGIQSVAPGIAVVPAPSHTPGSQLIFVRLADGREYLFAGDIASFEQNWKELRARSRLVGDWIAPENRREVFAWLKTIRALKAQAPRLEVISGHDFQALFDPDSHGAARNGFSQ